MCSSNLNRFLEGTILETESRALAIEDLEASMDAFELSESEKSFVRYWRKSRTQYNVGDELSSVFGMSNHFTSRPSNVAVISVSEARPLGGDLLGYTPSPTTVTITVNPPPPPTITVTVKAYVHTPNQDSTLPDFPARGSYKSQRSVEKEVDDLVRMIREPSRDVSIAELSQLAILIEALA